METGMKKGKRSGFNSFHLKEESPQICGVSSQMHKMQLADLHTRLRLASKGKKSRLKLK